MPRRFLTEIEDTAWCPAFLREAMTSSLGAVFALIRPYDAIASLLGDAINRTNASEVLDLCSGSGGPWQSLAPSLRKRCGDLKVCFSDKFPQQAPTLPNSSYLSRSLAAEDAPPELSGFRTLFTCFHHFSERDGAQILRNAVAGGHGIGVFEVTQRTVGAAMNVLLMPLGAVLIGPFFGRWTAVRFAFTYLIPLVPVLVLWDGLLSVLRSYTVPELRRIVENVEAAGYEWNVGEASSRFGLRVSYIIGVPRTGACSAEREAA